MEKLQLKMRMLNVAAMEETWTAFDLVKGFWQKLGIKDESAIVGAMLSAGISEILNSVAKINSRDPEMMNKLKGINLGKGDINETFNVTI